MKNKILASLWILGSAVGALYGEGKQVARVKSCQGSAQVRVGLHASSPLAVDTRLKDGVTLNLPGADKVTLVFYADGHSEELQGPCLVRIGTAGCQVVHGGNNCLAKVVAEKRRLVLPQGGNLQSVGGSIAGISDPANVKLRLRDVSALDDEPRPPGAPVPRPAPVVLSKDQPRPMDPSGGGGPRLAPEGILLSFSQVDGKARLRKESGSTSQLTFVLKGSGFNQAVGLRAGEIALPALPAGKPYQLMVYAGRKLQQTLPFQILSPAQQQELAELLANADLSQEALVIDRLEQLGLPSLAAQRAEQLLKKLEDKDVGLLTYVYRLYCNDLHDAGRAASIRKRAQAQGCQLP